MARLITLLMWLLASLPAAAVSVAAAADSARPRIGLVLSGGGARGLAHVGVLQALEEARVPIDAIAGTSMGAVIGGFYAAGMSASEIEALVRTVNWSTAFNDRPPRADLNFRRKQDDREFLVRLPLGIKAGSFRLPRGLVQGQKLTQILRRETVAVAGIQEFDRLPTPFRAVATDLETGERIVLRQGDLTEAVRASMSAPGVFAPVEVDGRLLVDGGLVENLPVDVAKEMGVDIIIAVDVGFQPVGRGELVSALAVSNQMLSIMMARETSRQLRLLGDQDILILPELGLTSSVDFTDIGRLVELGLQSTRVQSERLAALAIDEGSWQRYADARARREQALPEVRFVRSDPQSTRYREQIEAELSPVVGQPLDPRQMESKLSQLYGDGNFESLDYRVVGEPGEQGLEIAARRKSWGPNYVHFGLELQDDFEGANSFNAGVRVLVTEVNRYGAEWQTDLRVGGRPRFATEFYQPIGYGSDWFVAPRLLFDRRSVDLVLGDTRLASYLLRNQEFGLDVGRELGSWGEFRLGLVRGEGRQRLRIGNPNDPDLPGPADFDRGEFFSRFSLDRLDDVYFPRHGESFTLQWNAARSSLGSSEDADRLSADWMIARSRGRNTGLLWATGGAVISGSQETVSDFFPLGGLFNLSGLPPDSLSGRHFGIARGLFYRRVGKGGDGFLDVPTYLGVSVELGNVWDRRNQISIDSARLNGSAFIGFDTFLGPVYLAVGLDEDGGRSFYLLLGRVR